MAIKLMVLLNKVFYEPSETVVVTVKIENDLSAPASPPPVALLKQLVFQASGQERTDPSWISKLWRPEFKPESTENRRNVRSIFRTEPATLLSASELPPGSRRQFSLRFRLPAALPPTYKGSSIRFSYAVEVRAVYELSTGSGAGSTFETLATSSLLVWPPQAWHHRQQQGAAAGAGAGALATAPSMDDPSSRGPGPGPGLRSGSGSGSGSGPHRPAPERVSGDGSHGGSAGPHPGSVPNAAVAGSSGGAGPDESPELPLLDYRLHQLGVKVRFSEVSLGATDLSKSVNGSSLALPPSPTAEGGNGPSSSLLTASAGPDQTPVKFQQHLTAPEQQGRYSFGGMPSLAGWVAPAGAESGSGGGGTGEEAARRTGSPAVLPGGFPAASWPAAAPLALALDDDDDDGGSGGSDAGASSRPTTPRHAAHHHHHHHLQQGDRGLSAGLYASAKSRQQQQLQRRESEASASSAAGEGAFAAAAAAGWSAAATAVRPAGLPSTTQVFGKSFMLSAAGSPVLKLTLQAPLDGHLQPGNTFGGLLDFRFPPASSPGGPAAPRCHQLSIMLETEEVVAAPFSSRQPGGSRAGQGRVMRVLHCEHQEITSHVAASHFLFTIPAGCTPSFRTPPVALRWLLRFELVVGPPIDYSVDGRGGGQAATVQTLVWPLPLVVVPPQTAQH